MIAQPVIYSGDIAGLFVGRFRSPKTVAGLSLSLFSPAALGLLHSHNKPLLSPPCICASNPSYSYLHLIFVFHAHTSNNSSSSPKFPSHQNISFSLSFNYFSSGIFCSRLMFTIFLHSLHPADNLSFKFSALLDLIWLESKLPQV